MRKDVVISIKGIYAGEEDTDSLELVTQGQFCRRKDSYYIRYRESAATGYENCVTTLKVDGSDCVTISRTGAAQTSLIIEKNRRHLCHYNTGVGAFTVGVFSNSIESDLTDEGGRLHFQYTLDVNASFASENDVEIRVRACKKA